MVSASDAGEVVVLGLAIAVLAFAIAITLRLRRFGGLENSLAHVVVDGRKRRVFYWCISTFSFAFVLAGLTFSMGRLSFIPGTTTDLLMVVAFTLGAVALLVMMANGLDTSQLTLSEELELRDTLPPVLRAVETADPPAAPVEPADMYVVGGRR
jgi:hypothetical protein